MEHIQFHAHSKHSPALAGNRTRVSRVAGENSTTEPPMHVPGDFWTVFPRGKKLALKREELFTHLCWSMQGKHPLVVQFAC